ncbi:unnamed protein product [Closterium sp. NIES-64]|nr:unnamed protein product [Closterium sp. NIES-64]
MRAVFAALDTDGDGMISADDLRAYSAQRGLPAGYALEFVSRAQHGRRGAEEHLYGERRTDPQVLRNSLFGGGWNGAGCAAGGLQAGGVAGAGIGGMRILGSGDGVASCAQEGSGGTSGGNMALCRASAGFAASSSQVALTSQRASVSISLALPPVDLPALLSSAAQQLHRGLGSARLHLSSFRGGGTGGIGGGSGGSGGTDGGGGGGGGFGVSYAAFEEFVDARDRALWDSFRCMDSNGDGRVSQADLERSMRVRVTWHLLFSPILATRCSHAASATPAMGITACNSPMTTGGNTATSAAVTTLSGSTRASSTSGSGNAEAARPAGLGQPCSVDSVGRACSGKMVRAVQQQQQQVLQQQQQQQNGVLQRIRLQACSGVAAGDPLSQSVSFEEFRDYFTLLPTSDHLFDYWISASCPLACHASSAPRPFNAREALEGASAVVGTAATAAAAGNALKRKVPRRGSLRGTSSSSSKGAGTGGGSSGSGSSRRSKGAGGVWRHLVAGGMAGATSRTVTAPLETLRLRMMVSSEHGLLQTCSQVWSEAGWRAFFRGNMVNVVRSAPQKAIDFFAFEAFKQAIATVFPTGPAGLQVVTAGALAGATSTLALYPLDVVRSRLTVAARSQVGCLTVAARSQVVVSLLPPAPRWLSHCCHPLPGIAHALTTIAKTEGVPALYRGLGASLLSILPEDAITYGCFDLLKTALQHSTGRTVGVLPALACTAHALTTIAKAEGVPALYRRLGASLLSILPEAAIKYSCFDLQHSTGHTVGVLPALACGIAHAPTTTGKPEGMPALCRGLGASLLSILPEAAITYGCFDLLKSALHRSTGRTVGVLPALACGIAVPVTPTHSLSPSSHLPPALPLPTPQYTGIAHALATIAKTEGVPALYRGLGASLLSILPEAAITYGCFDLLKSALQHSTGRTVGVLPALACGVASAFTGQLVAYPLELVARRLQVSAVAAGAAGAGAVAAGAAKQNLVTVTKAILAERGVAGLYQGIVPASLKVIPMAIVSFGVYESVKFALVQLAEREEGWREERERRREEEGRRRWAEEERRLVEEERRGRRVCLPVCKACCREGGLCGRQRGSALLVV